jgi:hypothetical protein
MNLSHAYSDRAPQPKSYLGIGLVVALHLAGIYALSAGLIKPPPTAREVATVKPLPPEVRELPPRVEPLRATKPTLHDPQPILVPVPIFEVVSTHEPTIPTAPLHSDSGPVASTGLARPDVAPPPVAQPQVRAPGAVCSVMPRPEIPVVNWSGEAVLQVMATVRGGRVVGSDFRVAQGALDGKTRRSLQRSVEAALAGYQCLGDAMFQQDFAFRLD